MDRRAFLGSLAGGLIAAPLAAEAQPVGKVRRVAYLSLAAGPSPRSEALEQGLRELGYVVGQNIAVEYRWAAGDLGRARAAAADFVHSNVDVIVTGGPQATRVAKEATTTTPIVMAVDYDPAGAGFIASLARPGGNITGLSSLNPELSGKRLSLLKEILPGITRVAVLWNPLEPNAATYWRETRLAARAIGVQPQSWEVRVPRDLERAVREAKRERDNAFTVLTDPVTLYHRVELADLAAKHHLPAIYSERLFVEAGGLMSYGANDREMHRHAAVFVDKILRGEKPADLPVEQPTTYELVLNLKTAKALGLTIPPSLLQRADQILE